MIATAARQGSPTSLGAPAPVAIARHTNARPPWRLLAVGMAWVNLHFQCLAAGPNGMLVASGDHFVAALHLKKKGGLWRVKRLWKKRLVSAAHVLGPVRQIALSDGGRRIGAVTGLSSRAVALRTSDGRIIAEKYLSIRRRRANNVVATSNGRFAIFSCSSNFAHRHPLPRQPGLVIAHAGDLRVRRKIVEGKRGCAWAVVGGGFALAAMEPVAPRTPAPLRLFRWRSGREVASVTPPHDVCMMVMLRNGDGAVVGGRHTLIKYSFRGRRIAPTDTVRLKSGPPTSMVLSPNGRGLAVIAGGLQIFNVHGLRPLTAARKLWGANGSLAAGCAFFGGGKLIVTADFNGWIQVWRLQKVSR